MKPSRLQFFFAQDWPLRIWLILIPTCCAVASLYYCGWPPGMGLLWLLVIAALALAAGFFLAILVGLFVLGPIYCDRAVKNGAPFRVGDRVLILAGSHRGQVSKVYSAWQGDSIRVELG